MKCLGEPPQNKHKNKMCIVLHTIVQSDTNKNIFTLSIYEVICYCVIGL